MTKAFSRKMLNENREISEANFLPILTIQCYYINSADYIYLKLYKAITHCISITGVIYNLFNNLFI